MSLYYSKDKGTGQVPLVIVAGYEFQRVLYRVPGLLDYFAILVQTRERIASVNVSGNAT